MTPDETMLAKLTTLATELEADAEKLDTAGPGNRFLRFNIARIGKIGFYGAGISPEYGGLGLRPETISQGHAILAAACGTTSFTQHQLHSGGGYVGGAEDESLKREMLPKFAAGDALCGIAFSHLRRPGPPLVTAEQIVGGWRVSGEAPWVTGWRFLDGFVLGAVVEPDNHFAYFYIPIAEYADRLDVSQPIKLSVMDAGDTVKVTVHALHLPNRLRLFERPADSMKRADFCGITGHVWTPLGCATGSVRHLRAMAAATGRENFTKAADRFAAQIAQIKSDALTWTGARADEPDYKKNALKTRAGAIDLALRAAQAEVAATGGSAHLFTSPAQRRLREASFYITVAQTMDVQSASLEVSSHG